MHCFGLCKVMKAMKGELRRLLYSDCTRVRCDAIMAPGFFFESVFAMYVGSAADTELAHRHTSAFP